MTRCLAPDCQMGGLGCDNMTVVLVCFLNGKPYKELCSKCSIPSIASVKNGQEDGGENRSSSSSEGYTSDEPSHDSPTSPSSTPDSLTDSAVHVVDKDLKGQGNAEDKMIVEVEEKVASDVDTAEPVLKTIAPSQNPDPLIVAWGVKKVASRFQM